MWDPLIPKYKKKQNKTNQISGGKKKKKRYKARQWHIKHVCKISKTAWTLDSERIWGFMLEAACNQSQRWCVNIQ